MRVRFIVVGKCKSREWSALYDEYLVRLRRFADATTSIVREATGSTANDARRALDQEGQAILAAISPEAAVVLLDIDGEIVGSDGLADRIRRRRDASTKELCVVIGGHFGVADAVRARADWRWSLSKLTFTHEMARVLAAEQVYRAYTILNNFPYSK